MRPGAPRGALPKLPWPRLRHAGMPALHDCVVRADAPGPSSALAPGQGPSRCASGATRRAYRTRDGAARRRARPVCCGVPPCSQWPFDRPGRTGSRTAGTRPAICTVDACAPCRRPISVRPKSHAAHAEALSRLVAGHPTPRVGLIVGLDACLRPTCLPEPCGTGCGSVGTKPVCHDRPPSGCTEMLACSESRGLAFGAPTQRRSPPRWPTLPVPRKQYERPRFRGTRSTRSGGIRRPGSRGSLDPPELSLRRASPQRPVLAPRKACLARACTGLRLVAPSRLDPRLASTGSLRSVRRRRPRTRDRVPFRERTLDSGVMAQGWHATRRGGIRPFAGPHLSWGSASSGVDDPSLAPDFAGAPLTSLAVPRGPSLGPQGLDQLEPQRSLTRDASPS